jgi:TP901 family phage tail tape measure protein
MADDIRSDIRIGVDTSQAIAEIKQLQRQISQLNTQLIKSGAQQAQSAQNIQRDLIKNINSTGKFAANVRTISTTAESFTTALERNKLSMGEYFRYAGASTKTFGRLFKNEFATIEKVARERVKTLQTQYIKLGRDANGAMKAISVRPLALDMESLATKTALAAQRQQLFNQLLKQGSTNLLNFGKNTQWAGRQLMVGFSIPLAYMGAAAAREFRKIEEQAIRFKRVYGDAFSTQAETDKALENMKQLADEFTKYGIEVNKTLELAADVAQMGLKGADLRAQVTEATRLAVLGEVEQQEAMAATISVTNAFGTAAEDLAEKINFLNAVENETVTAIQDLTIAIPKAGPVVKQLGGDVEDLAFFLTAMKEGGINASEGANALKSGLASLINPTDKAAAMLQGFGINLRQIVEVNKGNVTGIVIDFAKALDTLDPLSRARAIEQLFGKFQFSRLSTLFQNVVKEGTQASKVLALASKDAGELAIIAERELKRVEESPLFKFQKQLEKFQAALAPLGEQFLKAITPLLEFGTDVLKNFNNMSEGAKQFAVIAATVVAGIGPVFLMMFGLIANGAANIIKLFANLARIFTGVGKNSKDLGISTEYMTQQQLEAAAVAASLNQTHSKLIQTFTSEAAAIDKLAISYGKAILQQSRLLGVDPVTGVPLGAGPKARPPKKLARGIVSVPGPKGAGDVVPAMLSPGEAVIPTKQSQKYAGLIQGMIDDNIPGYSVGRNPFAGLLRKNQNNPIGTVLNFILGRGKSLTEYEGMAARRFLRSRPNIAVRMPMDKFSELASTPGQRYKSLFETGFSKAGDTTAKRAQAEAKIFGLPENIDPSMRPVYGYLYKKERGLYDPRLPLRTRLANKLFGRAGSSTRGSELRHIFGSTGSLMNPKTFNYGNIAMLLNKRKVGKRTTFTFGDSYQSRNNEYATPAPFGTLSARKIKGAYTSKDKDFFEAQIMGGFTLKDVRRIVATEPALIPQIQRILQANGLKIPVGMPRFSMMQRLQKLVYGKKMYEERLPFTAKYGPKAGKYTMPPVKIGNRRVWLNNSSSDGLVGTAVKDQTQSKARRDPPLYFDKSTYLTAAHMEQAGVLGQNRQDFERTMRMHLADMRRTGFISQAEERQAQSKLVNLLDTYQTKQKAEVFASYRDKVEFLPKTLNPEFDTTKIPIKEYMKDFSRMPKGLIGSGILTRIPDDANIPNKVLRRYILTYRKSVLSSIKAQMNAGATELTNESMYPAFQAAERKAEMSIKDPGMRRLIQRINMESNFPMTIGYNKAGGSGYSRGSSILKEKSYQKLLQKLRERGDSRLEAIFPGILDKVDKYYVSQSNIQVPRDMKGQIQQYIANMPGGRNQRIATLNQLIEDLRGLTPSQKRDVLNRFISGPVPDIKPKTSLPYPVKTPVERKKVSPKNSFTNIDDITSQAFLRRKGFSVGSLTRMLLPLIGLAGIAQLFGSSGVLKAANGVFSVPGPKGAGDIVPAMLSPGESVIPARQSAKYAPLVQAMINDSVPGYNDGLPPSVAAKMGFRTPADVNIANSQELAKQTAKAGVSENLKKAGAFVSKVAKSTGQRAIAAANNSPVLAAWAAKTFGNDIATTGGRTFEAGTGAEIRTDKRGIQYGYIPGQGRVSVETARTAQANVNQAAAPRMPGAGAGMGLSVLGMGAMAYGMSGQPGSQIAGALSMPLMLAPMLLPMLANPIGKVIAVLALFAGAMFFLQEQLKNARKEGIKTAEAMTMTAEKLQKISEFSGKVTASELAERKREDQLTGQGSIKRQFGQTFLESDIGKQMLADVSNMPGNRASNIANQLSYAVLQGALSQQQAASIGAALSTELKDFSITTKVTGQLAALFGPNGQNLLKDPLEIAIAIQEQSGREQEKSYENAIQKIEDNAAIHGGTIGNLIGGGIMTAAGAVMVATGFLAPLGLAISAAGIGTMVASGINEGVADGIENAKAAAIAIIAGTEQIRQNQGLLDSVESRYNTQIDELEAKKESAKTDKERLEIEDKINSKIIERDNALVKLKGKNDEIYNNLIKQAKQLGPENFQATFEQALDYRAENAPQIVKDQLEIAKSALKGMEDSDFKISLQLGLLSEEFDATTVTNLINLNKESNGEIEKSFKLLVRAEGTAKANQLMQILSSSNLTATEVDVIMNYTMSNKQDFDTDLEAISQIVGMAGEYGLVVKPTVENIEEVGKFIKETENLDTGKPITRKILTQYLKEGEGADGKPLSAKAIEELQYMLDNWDVLTNGTNKLNYQVMVDFLIGNASDAAIQAFYLANNPKEYAKFMEGGPLINTPDGPVGFIDEDERAKMRAYFFGQGSGGDNDDPGEGTPPGGDTGTPENVLKQYADRLKRIRNAAIDTTGTVDELIKRFNILMKPGSATSTLFRGTDQKLLFAGYSKQFIDAVMSMDEATRSKFVSIKNGIIKVTQAGKDLNAAMSEITLGDAQFNIASGVADVRMQMRAMEILTKDYGMSAKEAFEMAKDASLAYAIVTRGTSGEIQDLIKWTETLRQENEKFARSTPEGMQAFLRGELDKVLGALDLADQYFQAQEQAVERDFQDKIDPIAKLIRAAEQDIVNYQDKIDDLNYQLTLIEDQESKINDEYDRKLEALDKIERANDSIAAQQKSQLALADALSQGDISAAARAVQEIRSQAASDSIQSQRNLLEEDRQRRLDALAVSLNGKLLTRKQIEEEIKTLQFEIAKIEEQRLEPNQKLVREYEIQRDLALEAIGENGYLGKTKAEWDKIAIAANKATVESKAFNDSVVAILSSIKGFTFGPDGKLLPFNIEEFKQGLTPPESPSSEEPNTNENPEDSIYTGPSREELRKQLDALYIKIKNAEAYIAKMKKAGKRLEAANATDKLNQYLAEEKALRAQFNAAPMGGSGGGGGGPAQMMMAKGGMVPKYLRMGGLLPYKAEGGSIFKPLGTDTIPAMLTPGEFVVRKYAVDKFGVDRLKAINSGTYKGDSVYNYEVSVNVQTDANPDQIARAVIGQIRQIESQRIRGNRF